MPARYKLHLVAQFVGASTACRSCGSFSDPCDSSLMRGSFENRYAKEPTHSTAIALTTNENKPTI
jgi:phosphoheptose isomerase